MTYQDKTGCLSQGAHPGSYNGQDAYNDMLITSSVGEINQMNNNEKKNTEINLEELKNEQSSQDNDSDCEYIVRRLTPTECARLQGFPDDWVLNIGIEEPTQEDIDKWREYFETYDLATKETVKKRTDTQIIKFLKNPNTDSAEYKLWGNGIALPCILPMMRAMAKELSGSD